MSDKPMVLDCDITKQPAHPLNHWDECWRPATREELIAALDINYLAAGWAVHDAFHPDGDHIARYTDVGRAAVDAALAVSDD